VGKLKKGYVQVYTGDGKGKTTAALGLALRAAGYDLKVFIAQFIKGRRYSEIKALEKFKDNIEVRQYGRGFFIKKEPSEKDIDLAEKGLEEIKALLSSGKYDVVILDEINVATYFNLFKVKDVTDLINLKPDDVELVLTGRRVGQQVIEMADLVTEMREIKHYFKKGVMGRKGIER
jgi:cob(I)alamin adenosyltransferase